MFIFNHQLLLIDIDNVAVGAAVVVATIVGMLVFVAVTQHWFLVRSRVWETAILLIACVTLFRPGLFMDRIVAPHDTLPAPSLFEVVEAAPAGAMVRFRVEDVSPRGDLVQRTVALRLGPAAPADERLLAAGAVIEDRDGRVVVADIRFRSEAERVGLDFGQEVVSVDRPNERPPKELFYFLGLALIAAVWWSQKRRRDASVVAP